MGLDSPGENSPIVYLRIFKTQVVDNDYISPISSLPDILVDESLSTVNVNKNNCEFLVKFESLNHGAYSYPEGWFHCVNYEQYVLNFPRSLQLPVIHDNAS